MSRCAFQLRYLFIGAIMLVVSACATVDNKPFSEQKNQAYAEIPSIWEVQFVEREERSRDWRDLFDDPILAMHLAKAKSNNFDLQQAAINVKQANLAITQSQSTLHPVINGSLGVNIAGLLTNFGALSESVNDTINVSWDPDVTGVRKLQVKQSQINRNIQSNISYNTRQQVLSNVIILYVSIIQSDLQIALSEKNLEFLQERLRIARAQYRVGRIGLDQVSFADNNFQSAVASLKAQKFTSRQLRRSLSSLLGDFSDQTIEIADKLPKVRPLPSRGLPADVLHRRPDVKIAEQQIDLALNAYEITVKSDWPTTSITGSIGGGGDFGDLFNPASYIIGLGGSIFNNIYDGGLNEAQRQDLRFGIEAAILNYQNILRIGKNEIEDVYDQSYVNQLQLDSLIVAAKAGDLALELEQIRFELGKSDLLSVLQVQQSALSTNAALINTEAALVTTLVNAYLATGGDLINYFEE